MNRMGLVNFWYFDDQEFEFARGKLLIRGQNGSGKSISTQSFIPFILDGNKAPYRLDPFGSKDRRMEYYFLLDGQNEESAGYIWLEFKKIESDQYRTLVIGQRARKNADMQFWSGIILDNRRINRDFSLKKKIGGNYQILTKQEFKNQLGEGNFYSERASDYKAAVNRHLFGFEQLDQYDQFVDLLIKVRAPKLSKEFKPTKIYEIYNESLQVLGDGDILPMVESMEEIDRTQAKLEEFKVTKKALESIGRVYGLYNRYYLGKKAQNFLWHHDEYHNLTQDVESSRSQFAGNQAKMTDIAKNQEEITQENMLLQVERASLPLDDIEAKIASYNQAQGDVKSKALQLDAYQEKLDHALREKDVKMAKRRLLEKDVDDSWYQVTKQIKELDQINEIATFNGHQKITRLENPGVFLSLVDELDQELNQVLSRVDKALEGLKNQRQIQAVIDKLAQDLGAVNDRITTLNRQLDDQSRVIENTKDDLINHYYNFTTANPILKIDSRLSELAGLIREYGGYGDYKKIDQVLSGLKTAESMAIDKQIMEAKFELGNHQSQKDQLNSQLVSLIQTPDLIYPASDLTVQSRQILTDNKIDFISVYQALEFDESLDESRKNILEAQLDAANLLDAIIVNYSNYDRAKELLGGHDQILVNLEEQNQPGCYFKKGSQSQFDREVGDLIAMLTSESRHHFGGDGRFQYGLVEGFVSASQPSVYIGKESRAKKRQEQIAKLEAQIAALNQAMADCQTIIANAQKSKDQLEQDYLDLQVFEPLDELLVQLQRQESELDLAIKKQQEISTNENQAKSQLHKIKNELIELTRSLPYHLDFGLYLEVKDSLVDYKNTLNQTHRELIGWQSKTSQVASVGEVIEKITEQIDDFYAQARQLEIQLAQARTIIATLETYLNQESTRQLHLRVKEIDENLGANNQLLEELEKQSRIFHERNLLLDREITIQESQLEQSRAYCDLAREIFAQEVALGYVLIDEGSLLNQAKKAATLLQPVEAQKTESELLQALNDVQRNNFSALTNYGLNTKKVFQANELNLVAQRFAIMLSYQGKPVDFFEFSKIIEEIIENTQLLIVEKDKELFEKFFSDALATKLIRKINDAKSWVKDMSGLMEDLKTTSAISFSLAWKPKAALSSDDLATNELIMLLESDREILSYENLKALSQHFSKRIKMAKQEYLENDIQDFNYGDLVQQALDYREWFEFRLYYKRADGPKKELTNSAFNVLSGGEKAMAMYVPLFTAVNAQYQKSHKNDFPRIIALDEAFAGVDSENISSMFDLVAKLDFDFIMNSQVLWGTDSHIKELAISELYRPLNSQIVSIINYHWNGKVKTLL